MTQVLNKSPKGSLMIRLGYLVFILFLSISENEYLQSITYKKFKTF